MTAKSILGDTDQYSKQLMEANMWIWKDGHLEISIEDFMRLMEQSKE